MELQEQIPATKKLRTPSVPSVERSLAILELISKSRTGLSLPELSRRLGLAKSSTHCLLLTLERCGYLTRSEKNRRYLFGLKLLSLANMAINGIKLREQALPALQALGRKCGLTVHMAILDHAEAVIIEKIEPPGVRQQSSWVGKRLEPHCSAVGKALLSNLPPDDVAQLLGTRPLQRHNDNTITSLRRLQQELADAKQRGYAIESEEDAIGARCIGAPVFGEMGEVIGAVSVAGTTEQLPLENMSSLGELVKKTAAEIGEAIRSQTQLQRSA